jgi:hypothetical protein
LKKILRSPLLLALAVVGLLAATGKCQVGVGKFIQRGRTRLSLTGGWGQAFNQDYFVLGAGAGYFITQGWEAGVDGESWVGDSPKINKITPETRYIFQVAGDWFPYVGTFYRRTFYEDLKDADSIGGRFGAYMPVSERVYFGIGGVFERQLDCDTSVYSHCSVLYPEFAVTVGF